MNAVAEEVPQFIYASKPMSEVIIKAGSGKPFLVHLAKILGACPSQARPYKVREAAYRSEFPAEKAATRMTALMIDGSTLIPARSMPITQGEADASSPPLINRGSLGETMSDIMRTPTTLKKHMTLVHAQACR